MNYKAVVTNRYGYYSMYIAEIHVESKDRGYYKYKVTNIVTGIKVPERVGRNSYTTCKMNEKDGIFDNLSKAEEYVIRKLFSLREV